MKLIAKITGIPVLTSENLSKDKTKVYYSCSFEYDNQIEKFNVSDVQIFNKLKERKYKSTNINLEINITEKYGTYARIVQCA